MVGFFAKLSLEVGYFHPVLRKIIDNFECDACQNYKVDGRGFGHLLARDVRTAPWEQVDTDLIGPWKVQTRTGRVYDFSALTSIDRVTGLAELIRTDNKTSEHVAAKFEESWLSSILDHFHAVITMVVNSLVGSFKNY